MLFYCTTAGSFCHSAKRGRSLSPANRHKKAPEGSFAATLRGKDNDQWLLVGILDTDRQADVALLAVGQDHNAYLRPSALLVHVGIDIRIDVLRDRIQQAAQKGIAVIEQKPGLSMGEFPKKSETDS